MQSPVDLLCSTQQKVESAVVPKLAKVFRVYVLMICQLKFKIWTIISKVYFPNIFQGPAIHYYRGSQP